MSFYFLRYIFYPCFSNIVVCEYLGYVIIILPSAIVYEGSLEYENIWESLLDNVRWYGLVYAIVWHFLFILLNIAYVKVCRYCTRHYLRSMNMLNSNISPSR